MIIPARYYDGQLSGTHEVFLAHDGAGAAQAIIVQDASSREIIARWPVAAVKTIPARKGELRLRASGVADGARIVVTGPDHIARIRAGLPQLADHERQSRGEQVRLLGLATLALAAVIAAYIFGVPLLAGRIVQLVPPGWEEAIGDTVATQMEASLAAEGGLPLCDPDPQSLANTAIARFGNAAMEGSGSPFTPDIRIVRSDIPNAFALPGGRIYFHSALLNAARAPDEFAGVLAHEIGHVVHRDGMEQLISTAGTGALIGFILGDLTGLSVAAGLGAAIIDTRFSRDSERQADLYAVEVARRLDFNPAALAVLLGRVDQESAFSRALALLSTHPLTQDRKVALDALSRDRPAGLEPPFTADEWSAIRHMCGPRTSR